MINDKNKHTFCPAKWEELVYNPAKNLLYSCCRAKNIGSNRIESEQEALLNGVQDPSCSYCWDSENCGGRSLRHEKLEKWTGTLTLKRFEIYVTNACNLQCTYCCPAASSQWHNDVVTNGMYEMYPDWVPCPENLKTAEIIEQIKIHKPEDVIVLLGGELLINKKVNEILDAIEPNIIVEIPSNMCYNTNVVLDKLSDMTATNKIWIKPSIDTVNNNVKKYVRKGFDPDLVYKNINFILEHTDINLRFMTLLSPCTIWDIVETYKYILELREKYGNRIEWRPSYIHIPKNQSFAILTDEEKEKVIPLVEETQKLCNQKERNILDTVISGIKGTPFNPVLRKENADFLVEFNRRHNVVLPQELQFLLGE